MTEQHKQLNAFQRLVRKIVSYMQTPRLGRIILENKEISMPEVSDEEKVLSLREIHMKILAERGQEDEKWPAPTIHEMKRAALWFAENKGKSDPPEWVNNCLNGRLAESWHWYPLTADCHPKQGERVVVMEYPGAPRMIHYQCPDMQYSRPGFQPVCDSPVYIHENDIMCWTRIPEVPAELQPIFP